MRNGRLAQLVEHLLYTEGVGGSSPSSPTISQQASYETVFRSGRLAQLVEHLLYTEGVGGSSPSSPTTSETAVKPLYSGPLAQLVEQLTFNQLVAGSNPARPTISKKKAPNGRFLRFSATNNSALSAAAYSAGRGGEKLRSGSSRAKRDDNASALPAG